MPIMMKNKRKDRNYILHFEDHDTVHNIIIQGAHTLEIGGTIVVYHYKTTEENMYDKFEVQIESYYFNEKKQRRIYIGNVIDKDIVDAGSIDILKKYTICYTNKSSKIIDYIIEFPEWEGETENGDDSE